MKYLTEPQMMKKLGVSRGTLYNWRKSGKINFVRKGGRILYPQEGGIPRNTFKSPQTILGKILSKVRIICEKNVAFGNLREVMPDAPCIICGYPISVEHHIYGRRNGEETVQVCPNCHHLIHNRLPLFLVMHGNAKMMSHNLITPVMLRKYRKSLNTVYEFKQEWQDDLFFPYRFLYTTSDIITILGNEHTIQPFKIIERNGYFCYLYKTEASEKTRRIRLKNIKTITCKICWE